MKCKSCGKPSCKGNCGTGAKGLSPKQKKIAGKAGNPTKIDAADLAALRKKKK